MSMRNGQNTIFNVLIHKCVLIKCTNNKEYQLWINVNFCKHTVWLKYFKIQLKRLIFLTIVQSQTFIKIVVYTYIILQKI